MANGRDSRWTVCPACENSNKATSTGKPFQVECKNCGDVHVKGERLSTNEVDELDL